MNALLTFLIRLLEVMFVVGGIGCICSVIPVTAYRLLMVLFDEKGHGEEADPAQRQATPEVSNFTPSTFEPVTEARSDAYPVARTTSKTYTIG